MTVRGAAFLGIGAMVGAGIFALLGEAGAVAGSAVWLSFLQAKRKISAKRIGRALAVCAATFAGALLPSACGGDDTVDPSKAEQGIENSSLSTSTTQITSASCPDDVKREKGKTFTCDVKLRGGGKAEVTATQTSNHDTFSYTFKSGSVVLPGSTVDEEIEQDLADSGVKGATVNCPASVPVKTGTTVTCPVTTSSGRQATVSFTFTSSSGTVDSSSVNES